MRTWPAAALVLVLAACGSPAERVAAPPVLLVDLVPTEDGFVVDFGAVPLGTTAAREITLHADGTGDLHLEPPAAATPFGATLDELVVPAGGTTTLRLTFTPTAPGTTEHLLDLHSNAAPITFQLRGTSVGGEPTCLDVDTTDLTFDPVHPGCSAPWRPLTITNRCDVPASVSLAALPADGPFALVQHPPLPHWLAPGESFAAHIGFAPEAAGDLTGLLLIGNGRQGAARELPLQATALPLATQPRRDLFDIPAPQLDVLYVVDDAAAMAAYHDWFTELLQFWVMHGFSDFRLAVTTTSLVARDGCGGEAGRLVPVDGSRPDVLTLGTPDLDAHFSANMQVPACRFDRAGNHGLETAVRAASSFARPGVPLLIAFVATEDDAGPETVSHYVNRLRALRSPRHEQTRAVALVGLPGSGCLDAADGIRYRAFAEAFDGYGAPICDEGSFFAHAQRAHFASRPAYYLSASPVDVDGNGRFDDADLQLRIDGIQVPSTNERGTRIWSYVPDFRRIDFAPINAPEPGAVIEVDYRVYEDHPCSPR